MIDYIKQYKDNEISLRSLIYYAKNKQELENYIISQTQFLNEYNPDILERLYYILNDISSVVLCKYCNNKAKWAGSIKEGYKTTCCSKECESKRVSEQVSGNKNAKNKEIEFSNWQLSVAEVNDQIIIDHYTYDKYLDLTTNIILLNYLNNRYKDSNDLIETLHRIKLGIEVKPKCPICGKSVTFVGRKAKMFTEYCSNTCAGKSKKTQQRKIETQLKNWGTECCYNSEKYKQKIKEQYGVEYISQRPEVIAKKKKTFLEKYGYEYATQNPDVIKKMIETSNMNMLSGTSHEEEQIYQWLLELGYNVKHHYRTDDYPFNCDFYIEDYNLYLEYQGSFYHNKRAFLNNDEDKKELAEYQAKCNEQLKEGKNPKLKSLIDTWSVRDVIKRQHALEHNLNFLEIYSCSSKEQLQYQIELWHDCKENNKVLNYSDKALQIQYNACLDLIYDDTLKVLTNTGLDIIKHFQENTFFKTEKEIYAINPIYRRKLIQNRIKYLNRKEEELLPFDILSGFKKAAIHYGYSHFNPQWAHWFINKYNIKTIYDPCGGWGHHLLGMLNCDNIIYNDINANTVHNIESMKSYFNINNLTILNHNACEYIPENVDAFFMCPPYYNLENYGNEEFKDLNEYQEFLNKIFDIWYQNSAKIFGLIIREDYIDLIKDKYIEKYEIPMKTSHLIIEKKYKEYFYIFQKTL